MGKLGIVIRHEYGEVVKKKSFLIGTLLTPLFMFAIIFLPSLLIDRETKDPIEFTLVDLGSGLMDEFKSAFVGQLPDGRSIFEIEYMQARPEEFDALKEELNNKIEAGEIEAYVVVPEDVLKTKQVERYARKYGKFADMAMIEQVMSQVVVREKLADYDVPVEQVHELTRDVNLEFKQVGPEGQESRAEFLTQYLSGIAFVMILFGSIMGYGQHLLRAVREEKSNRIIEVLISSLKPYDLMMGKILGLGAASVTQMILWGLMGAAVFFLGSNAGFISDLIDNAKSLSVNFFISFAIFFVLGYFFYATIFALLGSIINSERDAQQVIGPITITLILPIMVAMAIVQNPDAPWVVAISMVPFFTPTMMILRASFGFVPPAQIIIGMAVLVVSIAVLGWLTAKIFRIGILMYGKRPSVSELIKWLRYK